MFKRKKENVVQESTKPKKTEFVDFYAEIDPTKEKHETVPQEEPSTFSKPIFEPKPQEQLAEEPIYKVPVSEEPEEIKTKIEEPLDLEPIDEEPIYYEPENESVVEEIIEEPILVEKTENKTLKDSFVWANSSEVCDIEQPKKKLSKKDLKKELKQAKKANKKITPEPIKHVIPEIEKQPEEEKKVDLNSFFEASKTTNKLKRRDRKKYSKKELKRRKKRASRTRTSEDIKDQKIYKFRKKKYIKVEDFISYLNDHYLDIDDVAHDVLADENFFGWISKKSGMFDYSLQQFKEILAKIEKNS